MTKGDFVIHPKSIAYPKELPEDISKSYWQQFGRDCTLTKYESIHEVTEIFIKVKLLRYVNDVTYVMPVEYVKEFVDEFGFGGAVLKDYYMSITDKNKLVNPEKYIRVLKRY